jgi:hypothetical protein
MNDQLIVLIRYAVTGVVAFGAGRHWFTAADATALDAVLINAAVAIAGAIPTVIGVVTSSKSAKVAAVQAMPDMEVATSNQAVKDAVPGVTMAKPGAAQVVVPAPIAPKP